MKNTNKAQAINEMNTYINSLVPKLVEYVENNEIKTKTDGSLFEKNRKAIREIIECDKPKKSGVFLSIVILGTQLNLIQITVWVIFLVHMLAGGFISTTLSNLKLTL